MLLGLIVGMAVAGLLFALIIRSPFPPLVVVYSSAFLIPCLSGFVAGLVGRSHAAALGVALLGFFAASNLASVGLWAVLVAILVCMLLAVASAQLAILARRRSPWALIFPVAMLAVIGWQARMVHLDLGKRARFEHGGLPPVLRQVSQQLVDLPPGLQWTFGAENDVTASAFIADGKAAGRRYRVWVGRNSLRLRQVEVDIPPAAIEGLCQGAHPALSDLATARAYLLALGFHAPVADALRPTGSGFFLERWVAGRQLRGQLDATGAVAVCWGSLHRSTAASPPPPPLSPARP